MDPENMPNPVSVITADRAANGGSEYFTSSIGQPPPLVTTPFKVVDNGVSSPRFMRSTLYSFPATSGLANECRIPMALVVQPLADVEEGEVDPPLVDHGASGPIRCKRCKAYMNPFSRFMDGGRQYICAFCQCNNEVPGEYFSYLDHSGRRTDISQRPELCYGSYEFVATEDYCKKGRLPSPPAYLFMIDVSAGPLQNGMVNLLSQNIKRILSNLPKTREGKTSVRVGFAAYDTAVYFFNLKSASGVPQMMVVTDLEDVFVPLVDGVLVSPEEAMQSIESLFTQLPGMFIGCKKPTSTLGPVLKGGLEALRSGGCNGKLFVFHHGLPSVAGPGQLKDRLDQKLLGTDKEKNLLSPASNFYSKLAEECVDAGVGIDLFMSTSSYSDLATIGYCIATTGGDLHHYSLFRASVDGEKMMMDVTQALQRRNGFDCVMRLRASSGIRPVEYFGGFYKNNPTDMEFGSIDSEKAVAVEIKHDERLKEGELVYFQVALLYTSIFGERRLRVHNLQLTTTSKHLELYRGCDQDSILNFMLKKVVRDSLSTPHKTVSANLTTQCVKILTTYRKHCSQNSAPGQLILPESLKLLPIYANCLLKCGAVRSPPMLSIDHKSAMMWTTMGLGPVKTLPLLYPHLYQLHDLHPDGTALPGLMRCTGKKVSENGVYLIENGVSMVIWVGSRVSNEFVSQVFGVGSQAQIDPESVSEYYCFCSP
jgi:protein transport protein SEC24